MNEEELTRLALQDKLLIAVMGGTLPEQKETQRFKRVLDIGCATGGWVVETARAYPKMHVTGIDINQKAIEYAKTQAAIEGVSERASFLAIDALALPGLEDNTFDLVNQRMGSTYLRIWEWPQIMREMARVTRPGGIIRLSETNVVPESNSDALMQLCKLFLQAFVASSHISQLDKRGIIPKLATFLAEQRCQDIQTLPTTIEYRAGTEMMGAFYEDVKHIFRTYRPFIFKWSKINLDYDAIYQQMLEEIQKPDFYANVTFSTVWGRMPV
jgi:ubiquinone/menaquinone biosynthesis C-methylase UbiE